MKKLFVLLLLFGCVNDSTKEIDFKEFVDSFNNKKNNFSNTSNRLSEEHIFSQLSEVKNELNELRLVVYEDLSNEEKVDYKFIESLFVGKEIRYEDIQEYNRKEMLLSSSELLSKSVSIKYMGRI